MTSDDSPALWREQPWQPAVNTCYRGCWLARSYSSESIWHLQDFESGHLYALEKFWGFHHYTGLPAGCSMTINPKVGDWAAASADTSASLPESPVTCCFAILPVKPMMLQTMLMPSCNGRADTPSQPRSVLRLASTFTIQLS